MTFTITPGMGGASAAFGTAPMGCTLSAMNTVAVCTIGMSGVVSSPTFTANGTIGGLTIVATANGVPPTTFTETNTGIAPTAVNDAYTTAANTALTVPAATITASTQPAHGTLTLNATDGSFVYTPTSGYVGSDSFTYTISNGNGSFGTGSSTGTVTLTVNAALVTGLTTVVPTGAGSGNTGSASNPTLNLGSRPTLTTSATFNNGTSGAVSGLMYTSSNPAVATVDGSGNIVALTAGTTTITGLNGTRTTITVTVTGAARTRLMPAPQPMAHGSAPTAVVPPAPQSVAHPGDTGTGSGVQPQTAGQAMATPNAQPRSY